MPAPGKLVVLQAGIGELLVEAVLDEPVPGRGKVGTHDRRPGHGQTFFEALEPQLWSLWRQKSHHVGDSDFGIPLDHALNCGLLVVHEVGRDATGLWNRVITEKQHAVGRGYGDTAIPSSRRPSVFDRHRFQIERGKVGASKHFWRGIVRSVINYDNLESALEPLLAMKSLKSQCKNIAPISSRYDNRNDRRLHIS